MKKTALLLLLILLLPVSNMEIYAQDLLQIQEPSPDVPQVEATSESSAAFADEFSISYGRASIPGIAMTLGAIFGTVFTFGLAKADSYHASGAIGAEYFHYFGDHFAVGCDFIFEQSRLDFEQYSGKDTDGNSLYRPGSSTSNMFLSLMPGIKYRWLSNPKFGMFSKLCVGGMMCYSPSYTTIEKTTDSDTGNVATDTVIHDATNSFTYSLQLTLLGMEWGGSHVRGFTELGLGMQGLLIAGIRYRL